MSSMSVEIDLLKMYIYYSMSLSFMSSMSTEIDLLFTYVNNK